jgi:phosphate/phosphite/phosphonate ABC transporter binding protein
LLITISLIVFACDGKEVSETTLSGQKLISIAGSEEVFPLLKRLASSFRQNNPDVKFVFSPDSGWDPVEIATQNPGYDLVAVLDEQAPVNGIVSRKYLHLAQDALAFVTNEKVKVSRLNPTQIADIYKGRIRNWASVGGPDAEIVVIDWPERSSAKRALLKVFLDESSYIISDAVVAQEPLQVSALVQATPYSIGYMSKMEVWANQNLNIVKVDGFDLVSKDAWEEKDKFFRFFGLVLSEKPKEATMRFVAFIFSDGGSKVIEYSGYFPHRYEIKIGIVPEQNVLFQSQRYQPLANYLSEKLGGEIFSVRLRLAVSYAEVCRSLAEGETNAAILGSLAYESIRGHVDVLARPEYDGVSTYRGILFARDDSSIFGVEQMRGKRLALVEKPTMAGYLFPLGYFRSHGISDYQNYFSRVIFAGTHEDSVSAVLRNQADVGAAKDLVYHKVTAESPAAEHELRILAESPPVPTNAFVVRKNLTHPCFGCHQAVVPQHEARTKSFPQMDLKASIKKHLLTMHKDTAGKAALAAIGDASRFIETKDSDYLELHKMIEETGITIEELLIRDTPENLR